MSKLSKVSNRFLVLCNEFSSIKENYELFKIQSFDSAANQLDALNNLFVKLNKYFEEILTIIKPEVSAFLLKLNICDPITGEKRFGISTQQKILQLNENVLIAISNIEELLNILKSNIDKIHTTNSELDSQLQHVNTLHNNELLIYNNINNDEQRKQELFEEEKQKTINEEIELNIKAQEIRERKAYELEQKKSLYLMVFFFFCYFSTFPIFKQLS
jgi:hypothetical protein